jgi:hypothetical protein
MMLCYLLDRLLVNINLLAILSFLVSYKILPGIFDADVISLFIFNVLRLC